MRPSALALLGLLAAATAPAAQAALPAFMLADAVGDADRMDVSTVAWTFAGGNASVDVVFADGLADDAAVRGVFLIGTPGAPEPAEWYQFTLANGPDPNGTQAFAAHGTPHAVAATSSWAGSTARITFGRSEPAEGDCLFAVVESGTLGPGGFGLLDVAPRGFASMAAAWPVDACPQDEPVPPADETEDEKGSPGLGALALLAGLAVAATARRR